MEITNINDLWHLSGDRNFVQYINDELVILDNLCDVPDITAKKIGFNVVAACLSGCMTFNVAGKTVKASEGQLFLCHSRIVLSDIMISPDFEGKVMCLSDRLLYGILQSQKQIWNNVLYSTHCTIINVKIGHYNIYNELRYYLNDDTNPFKIEILECLIRVALLQICAELINLDTAKGDTMKSEIISRKKLIFNQFLKNIARRKIKKISVLEYANELCISPKYLSTICRDISGKSPIKWINDYVVEDIVVYLISTDLTAKEISIELGFPNASFFGKYVKEHLGVTPYEYRKKTMGKK